MRFCSNCGKKIFNTTKFCPYCGAKQPVPLSQRPQQITHQRPIYQQRPYIPYPKRHTHRKWYAIAAIIIVLIVGFIGYKHSTLSINLNNEIPNDTWTLKDSRNDKLYKVRFHHNSTTLAVHRNGHRHTIRNIFYLRPTSRNTIDYIIKDDYDNLYMKMQYKVKSGNANHFKLRFDGKMTELIDGTNIHIHKSNHHFIATFDGHTKKVPESVVPKSQLHKGDLILIKEK